MARKRMFSKDVVWRSEFVLLSCGAQRLYFHLGMDCDDEGFVEYVLLMRKIEAKKEELRALQVAGFVTVYNLYTLRITDNNINNSIPKDRWKPSRHRDKFLDDNLELDQQFNPLDTECIQNDDKMYTQIRLDKVSLDKKDSLSGKEKKPDDTIIFCERVITYLNKKTKKKEVRGFHNTKFNYKFIKARLKEKYTSDDFKKVIDVKVDEWLDDPDMSKNLRPQTLFGNNFESYLVQEPVKKSIQEEVTIRKRFEDGLPGFMILNGSVASQADIINAIKINKEDTLKQLKSWRKLTPDEQDKRLRR